MKKYKTLRGWLKAVKHLADHQIYDLKGFKKEELERAVGSLMADMYNDVSEINDILEEKTK